MTEELRLPNVTPDDLMKRPIHIFGCGTVGRRVAEMFGRWGAPHIILCDFDTVEKHNVLGRSAQGYTHADIGVHKVEALANALARYNPDIAIEKQNRKLVSTETLSGFVFACVDDMEARMSIRESAFESPEACFLCEARLTDSSGRVFALNPHNVEHQARYSEPPLWYSNSEIEPGGCGSPSMYPLTAIDATRLMTGALFSFLRREKGSPESFVNMSRFISIPSFVVEEEEWC